MARPKVDQEAIKNQIVSIAEALLVETDGQRLSLSDIAKRMSVSQPYIFRHFKNKKALIGALAEKWFRTVEAAGDEICNSNLSWSDKLKAHTIETLRIKKAAYTQNPKLFAAYLKLASNHMDIVQNHSKNLTEQIAQILTEANDKRPSVETLNLVLDVTVQFRSPYAIQSAPMNATEARANKVMDALIYYLKNNEKV